MSEHSTATAVHSKTENPPPAVEGAQPSGRGHAKARPLAERWRERGVTVALVSGLLLVLVVLWELVTRLGLIPTYLLPSPGQTAVALWTDATDFSGFWAPHFFQTFLVVLAGFGLAAVAGLLIGPLVIIHPLIERAVYPLVVAFQTIPKVALAPLILVWLGYGDVSKIMIAALVGFFPVVVNVITGLKAGDQRQLLLMQSLRASWWTRMKKVRIPNALPYVFAGLDIAVVFAVIGAVVAEFLGSANGLGSLVIVRQTSVDIAGLFSVLFFLAVLGYVLHVIITKIGNRLTFWAMTAEGAQAKP